MAYIKTISPENAEGNLKQIYRDLETSRGKIAEINKIQSLNPEALVAHMELYMAIMFGKSPLKRYQREMIGVVTSVANRCTYCVNHHEQALLAYWKERSKTKLLISNRSELDLSQTDHLLCNLAEKLTLNQSQVYSEDVRIMQNAGIEDRAILDAVQVIAYFNFVNRMVLGLGAEFSEEEMKGYKY
ncbi:MAG: peroxidase [Balneolaceae bacterium]|nr:MAG: peroxidase [Balneolaceae bacterium]